MIQPNGEHKTSLKFNFEILIKGDLTENFQFKINDDTEADHSCSAILNGEIFVFGGKYKRSQVFIKVDPNFGHLFRF